MRLLSDAMFRFSGMDMEAVGGGGGGRGYKRPLPPKKALPWSEGVRDFVYGYDVFDGVEKALRYKDRPVGVPEGVLKCFG